MSSDDNQVSEYSDVNFEAEESEKDEAPEETLEGVVKEALDRLAEIENAPYDGVLGRLDGWMPRPLKAEFSVVRSFLLDKASADEVKKWMRGRAQILKVTTFQYLPYVPIEYEDKVDALNYIKAIVDLGQEDGIKAYLGEDGFEVYRGMVMTGNAYVMLEAKKKKKEESGGNELDALDREIDAVLGTDPGLSFKGLLQRLENRISEGVIQNIDFQDGIDWIKDDERPEKTAIKTAMNRFTDAKKRLKKNIKFPPNT